MMKKINTEIIPVIHMINENQVLTNVETCLSCGIEKIFIINHQTTSEELIKCARKS
jgi:2-keto-3-deoxy-6-phosphogluconate aldolase